MALRSHLQKRSRGYYFRLRIPKEISPRFGNDLAVEPGDHNAFTIMITERLYDAIGIAKLAPLQDLERFPDIHFSRVQGAHHDATIYDARETFAEIAARRRDNTSKMSRS